MFEAVTRLTDCKGLDQWVGGVAGKRENWLIKKFEQHFGGEANWLGYGPDS